MPYPVDLGVTPENLLLGLVNYDNQTNFTPETLILIKPPVAQAPDAYRNTATVIRTTDPIFDIKETTVYYNRIDLGLLFSLVGCDVREVDVWDQTVVVNELLFAEISRRYNILLKPSDFEAVIIDGITHLNAKPDNLAYIGSLPIKINLSLKTRVETVRLSIYDTTTPTNHLSLVLLNNVVEDSIVKTGDLTGVIQASMLTYSYDISAANLTAIRAAGYQEDGKYLKDSTVFIDWVLSEFGLEIPEATPIKFIKLSTESYEWANQDYPWMYVTQEFSIEAGNSTNFEGMIVFHTN